MKGRVGQASNTEIENNNIKIDKNLAYIRHLIDTCNHNDKNKKSESNKAKRYFDSFFLLNQSKSSEHLNLLTIFVELFAYLITGTYLGYYLDLKFNLKPICALLIGSISFFAFLYKMYSNYFMSR